MTGDYDVFVIYVEVVVNQLFIHAEGFVKRMMELIENETGHKPLPPML
jgi:hypothetical protein